MISQWNREFEEGKQTLPEEAWDKWLWGCDMNVPLTQHVMLNEMHLLGLLIARYRARYQPQTMDVCLGGFWPHIVHGAKNVRNLTLRQLRDTIEDIQMHLSDYSSDWDNVTRALNALLGRFGEMNLHTQLPGVMDDLASTDPENKGRLSLPFIRRTTALMAVLYRHVHLASVAEECETVEANTCIEHCHIEAGLDTFYKHAMHADLPPGARIIYKQVSGRPPIPRVLTNIPTHGRTSPGCTTASRRWCTSTTPTTVGARSWNWRRCATASA